MIIGPLADFYFNGELSINLFWISPVAIGIVTLYILAWVSLFDSLTENARKLKVWWLMKFNKEEYFKFEKER